MTEPSPIIYGYTAEDIRRQKQTDKFLKMYSAEKLFAVVSIFLALIVGGFLYLGKDQAADLSETIFTTGLALITVSTVLTIVFGVGAAAIAFGIKRSKAAFYAIGLIVLSIAAAFGYYVAMTQVLGHVLTIPGS